MDTVIARYKENNGNKVVTVYADEMGIDPMKEFDNLGQLWTSNRDFYLGDKQFESVEELQQNVADENPVMIFDFSYNDYGSGGCSLYLDTVPYSLDSLLRPDLDDADEYDLQESIMRCDRGTFVWDWDRKYDGYYFLTKEELNKEYPGWESNREETEEKVKRVLQGQIDTYEKYLNGDVVGYMVTEECICTACDTKHEKDLDSCWGFYNIDDIWEGMDEKKADYTETYHI